MPTTILDGESYEQALHRRMQEEAEFQPTSANTPAPWHIEWSMTQGGEAHHICDCLDMGELSVIATVHFHDDAVGETKANAQLIAAAPELLAALIAAHDRLALNNESGAYSDLIWQARAAIANATGAKP